MEDIGAISSVETRVQRNISVEFSGGLETLFASQKFYKISIPAIDASGPAPTMLSLIKYICKNIMQDAREHVFVVNETIRPGILVLINDTDWELEGGLEYVLQEGDNVLFVSTLHGG